MILSRSFIAICASLSLLMLPSAARAAEPEFNYLIGRGSRDVTGPALGIQMWGFVRQGQNTQGIHLRLRSRTFVIVDPHSQRRIALACVDLGSITSEMQRSVVERLQAQFGDAYTIENVLVAATHTHSGPGGYWHYGANSPLGGGFYREHFDAIVDGIAASIADAHADLQPGAILINRGRVADAGAQRSLPAYMSNPAEERARYDSNTDTEMTLLRFVDAAGDVGSINWFAVHPTSMTYNNKLISSDHKGYAERSFERAQPASADGAAFVAAFAQSNCGDVTANLNLDNTGPGADEFESTRIIGERQLERARELFATATEPVQGPIDFRHTFVDFSRLVVADEFTGAGPQRTCPSAYGYAFAAGSTEDGGGHPLFREGMTAQVPAIDNLARDVFRLPPASDELRACQKPKAILFAPGEVQPEPAQPQIQPLAVVRIGQLVLIAGPAEFTTMSGRRIRDAVAAVLGDSARYLVIAGYANGYAGYVTTHQEYQTQQYEGGHTLFGPWTQAGYQQEFVRLATALRDDQPAEPGPAPRDIRAEIASLPLLQAFDHPPQGAQFGDPTVQPAQQHKPGDKVMAAFWTGDPRNDFRTNNNYLSVQHRTNGEWTTVATDADWETKCRFAPRGDASKSSEVTIEWVVPSDAQTGNYRIVHHGSYRLSDAQSPQTFDATSQTFRVE